MATSKIKKGDTVKVITGKYKGTEGKVISVEKNKVKVEGVNVVAKHKKASQSNPNGGIVHEEAYIDISNVMYVANGKVTRVGFSVEGDKKVRVAKATGDVID